MNVDLIKCWCIHSVIVTLTLFSWILIVLPVLFLWIPMVFAWFVFMNSDDICVFCLLLLSMCVLLRENGVLILVQVVLHGFCCYILLLLLFAIFKEYVKFLCVLLSGIMMLPVCFYGFGMVIYRVFCFQGFWWHFGISFQKFLCYLFGLFQGFWCHFGAVFQKFWWYLFGLFHGYWCYLGAMFQWLWWYLGCCVSVFWCNFGCRASVILLFFWVIRCRDSSVIFVFCFRDSDGICLGFVRWYGYDLSQISEGRHEQVVLRFRGLVPGNNDVTSMCLTSL